MVRVLSVLALAISGLLAVGVGAQGILIDQAVTGRQIADANGTDAASPNKIAVTADGNYVFTDTSDNTNERLYYADVSGDTPVLMLLTDETALRAKVDAVNGGSPAPAAVSIQGLGVDEDGNVIIGSDQSGAESGMVFKYDMTSGAITLLAGLDGPLTQTSVEGIAFIAVRGRIVYVVLEANFGALNGDTVATLSVDAPDGGQTAAEEFVSEDAFRDALGPDGLTDSLAFRLIGFNPDGNLLLVNGAASTSNDDILEIDTTTGDVSLLVAATDIEADIGASDIGPNNAGVDPNGTIYLTNSFGVGDSDDGVIVVRNAGGGKGDASLLVPRTEIIGSPNIFNLNDEPLTRLFIVNGSGLSPAAGTFVFAEGNCDCLVRIRETE